MYNNNFLQLQFQQHCGNTITQEAVSYSQKLQNYLVSVLDAVLQKLMSSYYHYNIFKITVNHF